MDAAWAWLVASLSLALLGAAATALRSALLILGEEGLEEAAEQGDRVAPALREAVRDPSLLHPYALWIASAGMKIAAALCAGAAALSFLSTGRPESWGAAAACLLLVPLAILLLEILVTREALRNPGRLLRAGGRAGPVVLRGAAVPARALDRVGRAVFGGGYSPEALMDVRVGSEEGIRDVIEEGAEHGAIDATEEKMLEGVLSFRETPVSEEMTPWNDVVHVSEGMTRQEVASVVGGRGHSRYPVVSRSGEEVVGILSLASLFRPGAGAEWQRFLERPVYVPESMKLGDLFRQLRRSRGHMAVVIDEHGKLRGVVTIHDLIERIVGRIAAGPEAGEAPEWEKDGALSVPAGTPVRILREEFGIGIPAGDTYETAAGYALDRLQEVPEGEITFLADGYRVTVVETEGFRIRRLRFERAGATGTS